MNSKLKKLCRIFALMSIVMIAFLHNNITTKAADNEWAVYSPDNKVKAVLSLKEGKAAYSVWRDARVVIEDSTLGISTNVGDFLEGLEYVSSNLQSWNNTYQVPSGKHDTNRDECTQLELILKKDDHEIRIYFRVYNDGVAFRYYIPGEGSAEIYKEYTEINLPDGTGGWGYQWRNEYEGLYEYVNSSTVEQGSYSMPFLASLYDNQYWALLTEANVYNADGSYCASILEGSSGANMKLKFAEQQTDCITGQYPIQTPQRVIIITDNLNDLANSDLVMNANPESKIEDTSWIKPGRAVWSWWGEDYYDNVDTTFEQQKRYVDYAAQNGIEYVTVDAGWADWTDGTIKELCDYASPKGVGIYIWANGTIYLKPEYETPDNRYYAGDYVDQDTGEEVHHIETWASWGVKGIKVDFMMDDTQSKMQTYQEITELCAKNHLMVNFHGSTKPGGENRTWPNIITSEAVRGAEHYLDWPPAADAYHNCVLPFTRNVIGAMDYTPVALSRSDINTTVAHQLALAVVYESGIQHFADSIDIYEAWNGTEFLNCLPKTWNETRVLDGFPGDYVIMARRAGNSWYIGAITDKARKVNIPLSFLEENEIMAYQYTDGNLTRELVKESFKVGKDTVIELDLKEHGGCAILISNETEPWLPEDECQVYEAESEENTLTGRAQIYDCGSCSGGKKVGYLGNGESELIFNHINGIAGKYEMNLYFLTEDERWIYCQVNDEEPVKLVLARASGSFDQVRRYHTIVNLKNGNNTIRFYHNDWAPDIDKISLKKCD